MTNLLEYLESAAERFPAKLAFSDENESITFRELRELAAKIGGYIAARVGAARRPVAVLSRHTVADVAAFFGTLYAGCFYVPLDASAPQSHIDTRLSAINPALVIDAKCIAELPVAEAVAAVSSISADPAYALFTSGSTGTPKAALVSHGSVINIIDWLCDTFCFSPETVFAGQAPFYFDSSVQEIFATIKCGATTHLLPKKFFISPLKVLKFVEDVGANVLPWAAAALKLIANSRVFDRYVPPSVTDVIFGGENMPGNVLNVWRRAFPAARFANVYGPTETAVECACYIVGRELADDESVPIGAAVRNVELMLLDEAQTQVKPGEAGEIYVRGVQVGLGYFNNDAATRAAFVQNPFVPYRDTIYRTGDIARLNERGELVFLARADSQVKHMGSRVELGEIESIASAADGVDVVCCGYDKAKSRIVMFYEGAAEEKMLDAALRERLPRYMQPGVFVRFEKMPALPNGKIDRQAAMRAYHE